MDKTKKHTKILIVLALISVLLILVGQFEIIEISNNKYYKYISFAGYFLQMIIWISYFIILSKKNTNEKNTF